MLKVSRISVVAFALGLTISATASADDFFGGKDLPHRNLPSKGGAKSEGNSLMVWSDSTNGGDVGVKIPDKYRGQVVRIKARVRIQYGRVKLGIDNYGFGLEKEGTWKAKRHERIINLPLARCPKTGNLYAVIRLEKNTCLKIMYMRIE